MTSRKARGVLGALLLMKFCQNAVLGVLPPVLADLADDFALSPTKTGTLIGIFGVARLAIILPLGTYLKSASRSGKVVFVGLVCSLLGAILMGVARGYSCLLIGRALIGLGHAATYLAGLLLILTVASREQVARAANMWEGVGVASLMVHGVVGGLIADRFGWRVAFAWASASVVLSCVAFLSGSSMVDWMGEGAKPETQSAGQISGVVARSDADARAVFRFTLVTAFTLSACWAGVLSTLVPLFGGNNLGLRPSQIGLVLFIGYMIDVALLYPSGKVMDRHTRTALLLPAFSVMAIAVLLMPLARGLWSFMTFVAIFSAGFVTWNIPATLIADLHLGARRGQALSVVRFVGDLGNCVAPVILGYLVQNAGYQTAGTSVAGLLGANLLLAIGKLLRSRP